MTTGGSVGVKEGFGSFLGSGEEAIVAFGRMQMDGGYGNVTVSVGFPVRIDHTGKYGPVQLRSRKL